MLAEIIHKTAEQFEQEDQEFSYRPSLLGPDRCIRQMVYGGLKIERKPLPGRSLIVFEDSSWHEELTLNRLRSSAFQIHSEQLHVNIPVRFSWLPERKCEALINGKACNAVIPAGCMAGHIDAIFTDMMGVDRLLEHKAINHFTFQKYWAGEIPMDYMAQCAAYILGLAEYGNIREFVLLIKNKNTSAFMEYHCYYNVADDVLTVFSRTYSTGEKIEMNLDFPGILTQAKEKFVKVHDCIRMGILPKRQYDFDHWRCEYCSWCLTCWEGYEQEFEQELQTAEWLPDDFENAVNYWKECAARRLAEEKEEEKLKEAVIAQLKAAGIKEGKAKSWHLQLKLEKTTRYDTSLLPEAVRESIAVHGFREKLSCRKLKIKEAVKNKKTTEE